MAESIALSKELRNRMVQEQIAVRGIRDLRVLAAVLAEVAGEVYTIERYANLAAGATERLARLGYANVHVLHGDGTRGWPEHAPYDAIMVAAGGPEVPPSLRAQLAIGGRLVIPVGPTSRSQQLVRI